MHLYKREYTTVKSVFCKLLELYPKFIISLDFMYKFKLISFNFPRRYVLELFICFIALKILQVYNCAALLRVLQMNWYNKFKKIKPKIEK